jgi:transcriptional regulator with XRE-family HTH domain
MHFDQANKAPARNSEVVALNVRFYRKERKLTQLEFGQAMGWAGKRSQNCGNVSKLETGKLRNLGIQTLERIAHVLGVQVVDLLTPKPQADKEPPRNEPVGEPVSGGVGNDPA